MTDLMRIAEKISKIDKAQVRNILDYIVESLKRINFSNTTWPSVRYHSFGSQSNGFGTQDSDIDLTLITEKYVPEVSGLTFLYKSLRKILDAKLCKILFIKKARVPLITITYQRQQVDIIMNNKLGILNTKLLKSYSLLHEKVKAGGILLKLWGKHYKVIQKHLVSSYAMILMWINFLQRKYKLPDLQDQKYISTLQKRNHIIKIRRRYKGEDFIFRADTRFIYHKDPLFQELQQKCYTLDNIPIEQLLSQFWQFYSLDGEFHRRQKMISIHQNERMDKQNLLSIIDPFDHLHNPGKQLSKKQQKYIFTQFQRASEKDVQELFQFLK